MSARSTKPHQDAAQTSYTHVPTMPTNLQSATVPLNLQSLHMERTGVGAVDGYFEKAEEEQDKIDVSKQMNASFYMARTLARDFIVRAFTFFLFATGLLALLAFFKADTKEEQFITALSVVINAVAFLHYQFIVKIRSIHIDRLASLAIEKKYKYLPVQLPFLEWRISSNVTSEMAVDALRHSDWMVRCELRTLRSNRRRRPRAPHAHGPTCRCVRRSPCRCS